MISLHTVCTLLNVSNFLKSIQNPCQLFPITDIDECTTTNNCHHDAICINTDGGYNCTCKEGYVGNGTNCTGKKSCYFLRAIGFGQVTFKYIFTASIRFFQYLYSTEYIFNQEKKPSQEVYRKQYFQPSSLNSNFIVV